MVRAMPRHATPRHGHGQSPLKTPAWRISPFTRTHTDSHRIESQRIAIATHRNRNASQSQRIGPQPNRIQFPVYNTSKLRYICICMYIYICIYICILVYLSICIYIQGDLHIHNSMSSNIPLMCSS